MTTKVDEKLGSEIIRKFFDLKLRPDVSQDVEAVHKKITGDDSTRQDPPGTEKPLEQPIK